jgi:predicted enzyme related to lactoylglutathione lyase
VAELSGAAISKSVLVLFRNCRYYPFRPSRRQGKEIGSMSLFGMAALTMVLIAAPAPAGPSALKVERFGLYVVSDDIRRSTGFYERLFGDKPQVAMPGMTGFDAAGALFAVVDRARYAPNTTRGDSSVPCLKVADVDAFLAHVRKVAPESLETAEVQREGSFRFIKLRDPDGNLLEFFSVRQAL